MMHRTLIDVFALHGEEHPRQLAVLVKVSFRARFGRYPNVAQGIKWFNLMPDFFREVAR